MYDCSLLFYNYIVLIILYIVMTTYGERTAFIIYQLVNISPQQVYVTLSFFYLTKLLNDLSHKFPISLFLLINYFLVLRVLSWNQMWNERTVLSTSWWIHPKVHVRISFSLSYLYIYDIDRNIQCLSVINSFCFYSLEVVTFTFQRLKRTLYWYPSICQSPCSPNYLINC